MVGEGIQIWKKKIPNKKQPLMGRFDTRSSVSKYFNNAHPFRLSRIVEGWMSLNLKVVSFLHHCCPLVEASMRLADHFRLTFPEGFVQTCSSFVSHYPCLIFGCFPYMLIPRIAGLDFRFLSCMCTIAHTSPY